MSEPGFCGLLELTGFVRWPLLCLLTMTVVWLDRLRFIAHLCPCCILQVITPCNGTAARNTGKGKGDNTIQRHCRKEDWQRQKNVRTFKESGETPQKRGDFS